MAVDHKYIAEGICKTGLVRTNNEDLYEIVELMKPDHSGQDVRTLLVVVADGMGGANAGEVASKIAVNSILDDYKELKSLPKQSLISQWLETSIISAHSKIAAVAMDDTGKSGLGTTISLALLIGSHVVIMWVGDSRAYRYSHKSNKKNKYTNERRLELLTKDHSLVWKDIETGIITLDEAEDHPDSHIITQSLGSYQNAPKPSSVSFELKSNETLLLCTDGLNRHLKSSEINEFLSSSHDIGLEATLTEISDKIEDRGAADNFTAVIIKYVSGTAGSKPITFSNLIKANLKEISIGGGLGLLLIFLFNWNIWSKEADSRDQSSVSQADNKSNPMVYTEETTRESIEDANNEVPLSNKHVDSNRSTVTKSESIDKMPSDYAMEQEDSIKLSRLQGQYQFILDNEEDTDNYLELKSEFQSIFSLIERDSFNFSSRNILKLNRMYHNWIKDNEHDE